VPAMPSRCAIRVGSAVSLIGGVLSGLGPGGRLAHRWARA
jgi:hypothetical protein